MVGELIVIYVETLAVSDLDNFAVNISVYMIRMMNILLLLLLFVFRRSLMMQMEGIVVQSTM